jgi:hypothetical protein
MARFYGSIGYVSFAKNKGIVTEVPEERQYFGDTLRNARRLEDGAGLNDDLRINNMMSVVADAYALENFHNIRYVHWMGTNWKVTNVEVQRPRLILTLGGVYNGVTGPTTGDLRRDPG